MSIRLKTINAPNVKINKICCQVKHFHILNRKEKLFFYHRIFFLLIFIMSTEMGLLPTFFSDLFHTLWFGKRILCDYKMKFKNTREIFICCDACYDGCDIYITTGGFNKKGKQKSVIYFQNWVYQMLHFS